METAKFVKQLSDYLLQDNGAAAQFLNSSCYIENSSIGRGLFAAKDFNPGEIIFCDTPFLFGPRYNVKAKLHCVICGTVKNIKKCPKGCGLPLCSIYCELSIQHLKECGLITSILKEKQDEISVDIFRVLMPLRALLFENKLKDLLLNYASHQGPQNEVEIQLAKKKLLLSQEQEEFLQKICAVVNANCFEAIKNNSEDKISIRALYPLAAIMNHSCLPNTFHYFDNSKNDLIIVKASVFIPKNSEIFTTYTSLLWGTTSRRHHLYQTKNFWCSCTRCADPKEFDTGLSGLRCIDKDCSGILYPQNSLIMKSDWVCEICGMVMPFQKVGIVQGTLGGLLKTMDVANLGKLICFLQERLSVVVPLKNQIAVEIKLKIIWCLGYIENYKWEEICDQHLQYKETICRELLEICTKLQMNFSLVKGQIMYELYRSLKEKITRINNKILNYENKEIVEIKKEARNILQEAAEILRTDSNAPEEIRNILCENNNIM